MKNGSKVSVLMNCYNSELYIRESVQSLIDQTYKDWELIVWDDASIDSTINIIQSFNDNRIKIYKNDTIKSLQKRLQVVEHDLYPNVIEKILSKKLQYY